MCFFCEQYGGGYERWYFNPANYARRLYKFRKEEDNLQVEGAPRPPGSTYIPREFIEALDKGDQETMERLRRQEEEKAWNAYFGQVITLEEALKITEIAYPIALVTCQCRRLMYGTPDDENFVCIGMGPGMYKWERWPDNYRGGVQFLSPEEAKEVLTKMDKKGLVHAVFTFGTPYLAGLCNCDYPGCDAIRARLDYGIRSFLMGHYVAKIDPELCNGCGQCVKRCQFNALRLSPSRNMAFIDQFKCFGCGLCATECSQYAIRLVERASLPALAQL